MHLASHSSLQSLQQNRRADAPRHRLVSRVLIEMIVIELYCDALRDLGNFKGMGESISKKIRFPREQLRLSLQAANCWAMHKPRVITAAVNSLVKAGRFTGESWPLMLQLRESCRVARQGTRFPAVHGSM